MPHSIGSILFKPYAAVFRALCDRHGGDKGDGLRNSHGTPEERAVGEEGQRHHAQRRKDQTAQHVDRDSLFGAFRGVEIGGQDS